MTIMLDIPFDPNAVCADCGAKGAYNIFDSLICGECIIEIQNMESSICDTDDDEDEP